MSSAEETAAVMMAAGTRPGRCRRRPVPLAPQQHVAVAGAAGHVGGEVARIDVGDRSDERGAQERQYRPDPATFTGQGPLGRVDDAGFARQGVVAQRHLTVERDRVSHRV